MTEATNDVPETKRTRGKAKRRNFASELTELNARVGIAIKLLQEFSVKRPDSLGLVEVAIEFLEGD